MTDTYMQGQNESGQTHFDTACFKYPWRKYQQRILDEVDRFLEDRHLHVVAPPGSGKTVLGLEMMRRLGKPALILAPTIAIRDQWADRFCSLFLQADSKPDWISFDIHEPRFITVSTYQGLYAACVDVLEPLGDSTDEECENIENPVNPQPNPNRMKLSAVHNLLKNAEVNTLILDEAHHLRNEWCRILELLIEQMNPVIVGLTATPPYDASPKEWLRYISINGPIDTEITIPELVKEQDLCPHQDYLYLTLPVGEELQIIHDFRSHADALFTELKSDSSLLQAVRSHPAWIDPEAHLEWILSNIADFSASIIYVHSWGLEIPRKHLELIGNRLERIPKIDYSWMEILLEFFLLSDPVSFPGSEVHQNELSNRLKHYGILQKGRISFQWNDRLASELTTSRSKLQGIREIAEFEFQQLGNQLRLVIIADHIRREYLSKGDILPELDKIGVIPVFELLRRDGTANRSLGVLTGSVIIIPVSACARIKQLASEQGIEKINFSPLKGDEAFCYIVTSDSDRHTVTRVVTDAFQAGDILVLIGTSAFLGEGWDAPAINTSILASQVGSFMLSNQMRGRAIRIQPGNHAKTANIWHLACVDPTRDDGGTDLDIARRKFRGLVGVVRPPDYGIESGIGRIGLPNVLSDARAISETNRITFALAGKRESLQESWQIAITKGTGMVEVLQIPFPDKRDYSHMKQFYTRRTAKYLLISLGSLAMGFIQQVFGLLGRLSHDTNPAHFLSILPWIGIAGGLILGSISFKAGRIALKYRDVGKDIQQICEALLETLIHIGVIRDNVPEMRVMSRVDSNGAVHCYLAKATLFERSRFNRALEELLGPIDNPRYLVIRSHWLANVIHQRDYHSVPEIIGCNRKNAEYFGQRWYEHVSRGYLIYTRNTEGRKTLLKARMYSLSAQFVGTANQTSVWK